VLRVAGPFTWPRPAGAAARVASSVTRNPALTGRLLPGAKTADRQALPTP